MKRCKILAAAVLAALLTGCVSENGGSLDVSYKFSSRESSFSSVSSSSESVSSSEEISSSSEESVSSSNESTSSEESSSSSEEISSVIVEEPVEEGVHYYTHDPLYWRKISFDGLRATVTGKIPPEGIDRANCDRSCDMKLTTSGDEFTLTMDFFSGEDGFTMFRIFEKSGSRAFYRLKFSDGEVCLPDSAELAEKNQEMIKKVLEQPSERISEYVSIGSDPEKVKKTLNEIKSLSEEICAGITDDYDKLRAIENWVASNIYYDYPAFNDGVPPETITLEYVLKNKSGVCGGFSNITAALAAAQGITVYNVHGTSAEGRGCFEEHPGEAVHEWNAAVIDGRVIWLDADFDSRNYRYDTGDQSGIAIRKYFDIDAVILAQTHRVKYAEHRDYFALLNR